MLVFTMMVAFFPNYGASPATPGTRLGAGRPEIRKYASVTVREICKRHRITRCLIGRVGSFNDSRSNLCCATRKAEGSPSADPLRRHEMLAAPLGPAKIPLPGNLATLRDRVGRGDDLSWDAKTCYHASEKGNYCRTEAERLFGRQRLDGKNTSNYKRAASVRLAGVTLQLRRIDVDESGS